MKRLFISGLVLSILLSSRAFGADLSLENGAIRVRGFLRTADISQLKELLSTQDIGKVIFGDSLGGTAEAAYEYAHLIRAAKLPTEVEGKCFSACAIAFVGGVERTFASGPQINILIFHMGRTEKNGTVTEYAKNAQLFSLLNRLTDGKLKEPARSLIQNSWSPDTGVLFSSEPWFFGRRVKSLHCDGSQGNDGNKCIKLDNSGPLEMGIVTHL